MYHVILDGSGSMTGPGRKSLQLNLARFIRQAMSAQSIKFWHWQSQVTEISPQSLSNDIIEYKNQYQSEAQVLADFTSKQSYEDVFFILSDGFSLEKKCFNSNHRYYWIMVGSEANPNLSITKKSNITSVHPEVLSPLIDEILNVPKSFEKPLVIDSSWLMSGTSKDEW